MRMIASVYHRYTIGTPDQPPPEDHSTSEPAASRLRAVLFYRKKEPGSKGAKAASGDQDTSSQIRHRPARCCFYLSGETAASGDHAGSRDKAVREIHFIYKIFLLQTDYRNKNRRCNRCIKNE